MCKIFCNQDSATYARETRAIRLSGHVTSIRLDIAFWEILDQIAKHEGLSLGRFVSILHDELLYEQGKVQNFASLLRVTCLHYLENRDIYLAEISARRPPRLVT